MGPSFVGSFYCDLLGWKGKGLRFRVPYQKAIGSTPECRTFSFWPAKLDLRCSLSVSTAYRELGPCFARTQDAKLASRSNLS